MPIQGGELPLLRNHSTFDLSFYFPFVIVIRLELLLAELLALAVEAVLRFSLVMAFCAFASISKTARW